MVIIKRLSTIAEDMKK